MLNALGVVLRDGMFADDTRSVAFKDFSGCFLPHDDDAACISILVKSYHESFCIGTFRISFVNSLCSVRLGGAGILKGVFVSSMCMLLRVK